MLTFTLPAGVTIDPNDNSSGITQSGTTVTVNLDTYDNYSGDISLGHGQTLGVYFAYDISTATAPPLVVGSVTLDGIPVS